jgi:Zn-dependent metalloprotease
MHMNSSALQHPHLCCCIAPPDLLARVAEEGELDARRAALETLASSASLRTQRSLLGRISRETDIGIRSLAAISVPVGERQTVYDVAHGGRSDLPGTRKRGQGDPPTDDQAANDVFENTSKTYDFYRDVWGRDSVDDKGMELVSSVHYGVNFDNAFWNGGQMVYGDGSNQIFQVGKLTQALDVIAHELTHGVTQFTAALEYSKQSGALNEHFSDVFGTLTSQYNLGQTADQATWLIGEGTLVPTLGRALRSMKEPGTAFNGDQQPGTMADYRDLPDDNNPRNDNGGVHINSGIPNRAFYLFAAALGGHSWGTAGKVWFTTLTGGYLQPDAQFTDAAQATIEVAGRLFGDNGYEQEELRSAWQTVGVIS